MRFAKINGCEIFKISQLVLVIRTYVTSLKVDFVISNYTLFSDAIVKATLASKDDALQTIARVMKHTPDRVKVMKHFEDDTNVL